jgi:hypothetical protein
MREMLENIMQIADVVEKSDESIDYPSFKCPKIISIQFIIQSIPTGDRCGREVSICIDSSL